MPSPESNRLFVSLDASLFAVFTPTNSLVSNEPRDKKRFEPAAFYLFHPSSSFPSLSLFEVFTVALIFLPANPIHDERPRDVRSTSPPDSLSAAEILFIVRSAELSFAFDSSGFF